MPTACESCRENLPLLVEPKAATPDNAPARAAEAADGTTRDIAAASSAAASSLLTPAERAAFEAHVAACPECARELARLRAMVATLHALPLAAAPSTLRAQVRSRIAGEAARASDDQRRRKPSRLASLLDSLRDPGRVAWASGVAIALFVAFLLRDQAFGPRPPLPADTGAPNATPAPAITAPAARRAAPHEAAPHKAAALRGPTGKNAGPVAPSARPAPQLGTSITPPQAVPAQPGASPPPDTRPVTLPAARPATGTMPGPRASVAPQPARPAGAKLPDKAAGAEDAPRKPPVPDKVPEARVDTVFAPQRFVSITVLADDAAGGQHENSPQAASAFNRALSKTMAPPHRAMFARAGAAPERSAEAVNGDALNGRAGIASRGSLFDAPPVASESAAMPAAPATTAHGMAGRSFNAASASENRAADGPHGPAGPAGPEGRGGAPSLRDEPQAPVNPAFAMAPAPTVAAGSDAGYKHPRADRPSSAGPPSLQARYRTNLFTVGHIARVAARLTPSRSAARAAIEVTLPAGVRFPSQYTDDERVVWQGAVTAGKPFTIDFLLAGVQPGSWPITITLRAADGTKLDTATVEIALAPHAP